jgi:hypothetical protein
MTPTRGFTAAVSVFRGTPPQKPVAIFQVGDSVASGRNHGRAGEPILTTEYLSHIPAWNARCILYSLILVQLFEKTIFQE